MKMALFVALALISLAVLSGLAWRRIKGKAKRADLVAKSNHKSVWSFHYGPASILPARKPAETGPPLATDSPLSKLMPAEDLRVKDELAKAEAMAHADAGQPTEKAQPSGARLDGVESALAEATVSAAASSSEREGAPKKMAPAAQSLSSRHAPGAKNVLDMLGTDEVDTARVGAPGITAVMPAVGEEPVAPDDIPTKDDTVPQTLYANALTEAPRTKNDEANRQAAVALKQRKRAALRTGTDGQKTALAALITEGAAPS